MEHQQETQDTKTKGKIEFGLQEGAASMDPDWLGTILTPPLPPSSILHKHSLPLGRLYSLHRRLGFLNEKEHDGFGAVKVSRML